MASEVQARVRVENWVKMNAKSTEHDLAPPYHGITSNNGKKVFFGLFWGLGQPGTLGLCWVRRGDTYGVRL
jgi:hypothetical protein